MKVLFLKEKGFVMLDGCEDAGSKSVPYKAK